MDKEKGLVYLRGRVWYIWGRVSYIWGRVWFIRRRVWCNDGEGSGVFMGKDLIYAEKSGI